MLKTFLKPKWQHKNPDVRKRAIQQLDWANADDRSVIETQLNQEQDAACIEALLLRTGSINTLQAVRLRIPEAQQTVLSQQLHRLLETSTNKDELEPLLADATPDILSKLFAANIDEAIKRGWLEQLNDSSTLIHLALNSKSRALRLAAANRLTAESDWQTLARQAQGKDKNLYRLAKEQLQTLQQARTASDSRQAQIHKLADAISHHARQPFAPLYEAQLHHLAQQWQTLKADAAADQQARIEAALAACEQTLEGAQQEQQQAEQQALQQAAQAQERQATLDTLSQSIGSLEHTGSASPQALAAIQAVLTTQENRWLEATRQCRVDKAEQKQYQALMQQLRDYAQALRHYLNIQDLLTQTLDAEGSDASQREQALKPLLADLTWPAALPQPDTLARAYVHLGEVKQHKRQASDRQKQQHSNIEERVRTLETLIEAGHLSDASKTWKGLQQRISALPEPQKHAWQPTLTRLNGALANLRDWQGFATEPKREALCEKMEALAHTHLEPAEKAKRIKALQDEWRGLGGSNDKRQWARFKQAADQAFKPCKAYFAEHDRLKAANLERRALICDELETLLSNLPWEQADWKKLERISRQAKLDWKDSFPVDHKQSKPLQQRFNRLIQQLDTPLQEARARNLALKQTIVEQAEALHELDDLAQAIQQAKQLQSDWQAVGITERGPDQQLWRAFRAACDGLFAKRQTQQAEHAAHQQDNLKQKQQLCEQLNQLVIDETSAAKQAFQRLHNAFKAAGPVPKNAVKAIQTQWADAEASFRKRLQTSHTDAWQRQWLEAHRRATLCAQVEQARVDGLEPDADTLTNLAAKPPLADPVETALLARQHWLQQASKSDIETARSSNEKQGRSLAVQCEILAALDSPDNDKALRMELQVAQLSSSGLQGGPAQPEQQLRSLESLLTQWYGLGPLPADLRSALQARIDQSMRAVLQQQPLTSF